MGLHRKPSESHDVAGGGGGEPEEERDEPENSSEIKFGEQLQDDVINSFCDKLQAVCPRRMEALLAIQFLFLSSNEEVKKHVTGRKDAMQVLYDRTRKHYVLVHYNPRMNHVILYDSLQPFSSSDTPIMIREIGSQIGQLFGHLFGKYVTIVVDSEYERQSDDFSCGYRCIGALVDLARQKNPGHYTYSRRACLAFLKAVIGEEKPTWQMFESAQLGRRKGYSGNSRILFHTENSSYIGSTSSSVTTSRASSTTSLAEKRASAGLNRNFQESEDDDDDEGLLAPTQTPVLLNPAPSIGFFDFLLAVYHTPLTWRSFFRRSSESEEVSYLEDAPEHMKTYF